MSRVQDTSKQTARESEAWRTTVPRVLVNEVRIDTATLQGLEKVLLCEDMSPTSVKVLQASGQTNTSPLCYTFYSLLFASSLSATRSPFESCSK